MLEELESLVRKLPTLEIADDRETADVIGRLNKIAGDITYYKRQLLDEMAGPAQGAVYRVTESRRGKRSYNTAALVKAFDDKGVSLAELARSDVARISWQWSKLKRHAYEAGVELSIAPYEIEDIGDLDSALIGETWETVQKVEGV